MRIILRRRGQKKVDREGGGKTLYLKVHVSKAVELIDNRIQNKDGSVGANKKGIRPTLMVALNKKVKKTTKKSRTVQLTWNSEIKIPLRYRDYSQVLNVVLWDNHKKYKNYLGELRLKLSDVFLKDGSFVAKTEPKWYKLYSNKAQKSFVTGSILLSFELSKTIGRKKTKANNKPVELKLGYGKKEDFLHSSDVSNGENKDSGTPSLPAVKIEPAEDVLPPGNEKNKQVYMSEEDAIQDDFNEWLKSLIYPDPDPDMFVPDDQGFYLDSDEIENYLTDVSDIESNLSASSDATKENHNLSASILIGNLQEDLDNKLTLSTEDITSDSALSSDGAFMYDSESAGSSNWPKDFGTLESESSKHRRSFGFNKLRKAKTRGHFDFGNRYVLGVLFIEIVNCTDLPPYKSFNRATFDMDPFVVVTFGKKTFRTSWKRHNLNPIFNERLAFEVLPHESNFSIQFSVLDKDRISYNDKVGTCTLNMGDVYKMSDDPEDKVGSEKNEPKEHLKDILDQDSVQFDSQNSDMDILHNDNIVETVHRKKFTNKKKVTLSYADTSKFKTLNLALKLHDPKYEAKYNPKLKIRVRFEKYESIRKQFWSILLDQYNELNEHDGKYDYIELISFLDTLGCDNSNDIAQKFFDNNSKLAWGGESLNYSEIIDCLEDHINNFSEKDNKIFEFEKCPLCNQKRLSRKQDRDIITHVAICASKDWSIVSKMLVSSYVSPQLASKRWFSKLFIKLTYGKYKLGGNSANILVQDRTTGVIMEEKMEVYVRLGIRLLYKGFDTSKSRRVRQLLRKMSFKQGMKFDNPQLKNDIKSFVKFHKLDLSECLEPNIEMYRTFNEFFFRRLKPGARKIEGRDNSKIVVSPADSRCTAFASVNEATTFWIKGKNFTLPKLFNGNFNNLQDTELFNPEDCSLGIFRLAPQDYHRFHSPVDGVVTNIKHIEGEYYTVNPMAIRSELDVFGENVRTIISIDTKEFGVVVMIAIGAMMVGSIVLTKAINDTVHRGEEVGYFKFGGSTVLLLMRKSQFTFDRDLNNNSLSSIETMVRVGQSIGHTPDTEEFKRDHVDFDSLSREYKKNLIRVLTGGDLESAQELSNWHAAHTNLDDILHSEYDSEDKSILSEEALSLSEASYT